MKQTLSHRYEEKWFIMYVVSTRCISIRDLYLSTDWGLQLFSEFVQKHMTSLTYTCRYGCLKWMWVPAWHVTVKLWRLLYRELSRKHYVCLLLLLAKSRCSDARGADGMCPLSQFKTFMLSFHESRAWHSIIIISLVDDFGEMSSSVSRNFLWLFNINGTLLLSANVFEK